MADSKHPIACLDEATPKEVARGTRTTRPATPIKCGRCAEREALLRECLIVLADLLDGTGDWTDARISKHRALLARLDGAK